MADLNSAKQQADDDLTWLARNVHRWIGGDYMIRVGKIGHTFREHCEGETVLPSWYTRDQWLTRRSELQNKPDWHEAPAWAEWLTQDCIGTWVWHELEPFGKGNAWSSDGVKSFSRGGEVIGKWLGTLERRPQAAESEPVSEPSSDDWHKRGELPPVGTVCVYENRFCDPKNRPHPKDGTIVTVIAHHQFCNDWAYVAAYAWLNEDDDGEEFGFVSTATAKSFRPIPTERERVASELVDVMMAVPVSDRKTASESFMSMALAIYDHLHQGSRV